MRLIAILAACLCASCATAPRVAPRFTQPSTTTITAQHKAIKEANASARQHIEAAKTLTLQIHDPADQKAIDELSAQLDAADAAVAQSDARADAAEAALAQLDTQLKDETTICNQTADAYDKAAVVITGLQESRHGWVKRFWIASALLVAAGIWIFHKPLLMMAGGVL